MADFLSHTLADAVAHLRAGGLIAYACEAVVGLGCDPTQPEAVAQLLSLKQRDAGKGLICIFADWSHVSSWVLHDDVADWQAVHDSWPGHATWVFTASETAPRAVCHEAGSIALRQPDHPQMMSLCQAFGAPIVSTSANVAGKAPFMTIASVANAWECRGVLCLPGVLGAQQQVSRLRCARTGHFLR